MPNSLADKEVSAVYGALDDDAFGEGEFVHAHLLRELKRQGAHEALTGNYLVHQFWNVEGASDVEPAGGRVFDASPGWKRQLGPFHPPRKPFLPHGELQIYARITNGAVVLAQIVTRRHARQVDVRSSGARNVLRMDGNGAWRWYSMTGIVLGRDMVDTIEAWFTADSQSGFDTATYGTPGSGSPTFVNLDTLNVAGAAWNQSAFAAAVGRNVVRFINADGAVIVPDRTVTAVTATDLRMLQPLSADQAQACNGPGVTFELRTQPAVRLGSFILVEEHGY